MLDFSDTSFQYALITRGSIICCCRYSGETSEDQGSPLAHLSVLYMKARQKDLY